MVDNEITSIPEEQADKEINFIEDTTSPTENVEKKVNEHKHQSKEESENIDFSSEEAQIAAESDEFDLENDGEIEAEENSVITVNFVKMNKTELNETFKNKLETQPIEQLRKDVDAIKTAFYKVLRQEQDTYKQNYLAQGNSIETYIAPIDKEEIEFKALFNSYKIKRSEYLRNLEDEKEVNYRKKLELIDELKDLISKKENINHTFQEFKDLQKRWKDVGSIPQAHIKNTWDTYNHHVENFYDYLKINKELRDMDFKKNLDAKIQLCEKTEELLLEPSVISAFRKLQKYHDQWREIGPVANELKESIWERFKEATSKINKKHQEYFESQKDIQEENLNAKTILCEKAEELTITTASDNKGWNKQSKELIELQKTWKTIGYASKKDNAKIYARFRKACDNFFAKKRDFYSGFKKTMDENYQKKISLCEQAEALADNTDWKKTAEQLIKLQKEWKSVGIVPRKVSNEIWNRFRTACDKFFNNRKAAFKEQDARYDDNLKAKEEIIAEIKNYHTDDSIVKTLDALKEFQRRWAEIGYVPMSDKNRIQEEYRAEIDKLFKALNISEKDRKIVKFKSRIENINSNKGQNKVLRSERDKLLQQIRQIESDIALWENNIGFFAKSKNAESLFADVQKKIDRAREEVVIIEEKIKLLDEI